MKLKEVMKQVREQAGDYVSVQVKFDNFSEPAKDRIEDWRVEYRIWDFELSKGFDALTLTEAFAAWSLAKGSADLISEIESAVTQVEEVTK